MIRIADIQQAVADHFGVSVDQLLSPARGGKDNEGITRPRQIAMYLAHEFTDHSTVVIGKHFHRDRTTIMHGCKQVERRLSKIGPTSRAVGALHERFSETRKAHDGSAALRDAILKLGPQE